MKKLILGILLVGLELTGSYLTQQQWGTPFKTVRFHSQIDPADYLDFKVPKAVPDFPALYEESCLCVHTHPLGITAKCIWHDGHPTEHDEQGFPVGVDNYYSVDLWNAYQLRDSSPYGLVLTDHPTNEGDKYFLYDKSGDPQETSEYEYAMYEYDIYGYPRISEEAYLELKAELKRERKELEKEQAQKEAGQSEI